MAIKTLQTHIAVSILAAALFFGCSSDEPEKTIVLPDYVIVKEDKYDAPVKTQVEQHILVTGEINEENLKDLLRQQFDSIMQRRGFKHHDAPTNVYIYTYDTKERAEAEQGLWLAMLQMSPLDNGEPEITIKREQIARIGQEPEEKFGLSEAQRKEIYKEIIEAERRATDEAIVREPTDINKQVKLQQELTEKYKDELANKYSLNEDQLISIGNEGITNQWPRPTF